MARGRSIPGFVALAAVLMLVCVMGGCSTGNKVTFTNVSDSWVSVRFFVEAGRGSRKLVSKKKFQIQPGETVDFAVDRKTNGRGESALVHLQVQTVTPSWEGDGKRYWMELITEGPVKIVVRGTGKKLEFETAVGKVVRIPRRAVKKKFQYHVAGAPSGAE